MAHHNANFIAVDAASGNPGQLGDGAHGSIRCVLDDLKYVLTKSSQRSMLLVDGFPREYNAVFGSFRFLFYSDEGNEPPHIHAAPRMVNARFSWSLYVLPAIKGLRRVSFDRLNT